MTSTRGSLLAPHPGLALNQTQCLPVACKTSMEGSCLPLKPSSLQPMGNFLSQLT